MLLSGDPTAHSRIWLAYYERALRQMKKKFSAISDEDIVHTGTFTAFDNYLKRPEQYHPEKRSLYGYLCMSAVGDIRNEAKRQGKYQHRLQPLYVDVAEGGEGAEYERELVSDTDVEAEVLERLHPTYMRIDALVPDVVDRQVVRMMLDGERETGAYAEVMGISDRPRAEQEREVKKCKDRLTKKLKRNLDPEEVRHDD